MALVEYSAEEIAQIIADNPQFASIEPAVYAAPTHTTVGGRALAPDDFAFPLADVDPLVGYDVVKSAIQQSFVDHGGTLSHHHAVGTEHARWMPEDISPQGVAMIDGLFSTVDPGRNLNPGKVTGH